MRKIVLLIVILNSSIIFSLDIRVTAFTDYYGQIEPSTAYTTLRQRNYIKPEISMDMFNYNAEFNISGEFYYDFFTVETMTNPMNILEECYLSIYLPWGDIFLGQKYINKGKADVFSPLNPFNASYKKILSLDEPYQSKLPDFQAEVKLYINDENSIELLYMPFPRADYQGSGIISSAENPEFSFDKESENYIISNPNSFFITYNRYGYSFDTQVMYAYYTENSYNYLINGSKITKEFNKVHTLGGAISSSIGGTGIVEEAAINITQLTHTLFNRTFGQLSIIYQHIFNYKKYQDNSIGVAIHDIQLQPTNNILFFIAHL
ncbi:MAG: hypothetical protein B6229_03920, partial [Spirochaetaceae bacterium 4572_7]